MSYIKIPCPPMPYRCVERSAYQCDNLTIIVTRDVLPDGLRWHLSISHPGRYPTWDEIRDARYALLPDQCTMAMLLPPKAQYVNLHKNCFHLHEVCE